MKFNRNIKGNQVVKINGMYQSRYFHDATYVQNLLNEVSPSFCLAKWYNVSIHIPTGKTHSCYHPPTHNIPLAEIAIDVSALHNTKYKKELQKTWDTKRRLENWVKNDKTFYKPKQETKKGLGL